MSLKELLQKRVVVLDGSMGTELEALLPKDHPLSVKGSPLWSTKVLLAEPSLVTQIHQSYVDVGCDMLITAAYQASLQTLKDHAGLDLAGAQRLWRSAVDCAKAAAATSDKKIYIAGAVGPYGAYLANGAEYSGDYAGFSEAQMRDYHSELVRFYVDDADVDVIAFETIPNIGELRAILSLLEATYAAGRAKDYYLSLSCKSETTLADGTPLGAVVDLILEHRRGLVGSHLVAVGCNCVSYELVPGILRTINDASRAANADLFDLVVYPNLGFENDMSDPSQYAFQSSTSEWNKAIQEWLSIPNVRLVGGCCSTSPPEVQAVVDAVKQQ